MVVWMLSGYGRLMREMGGRRGEGGEDGKEWERGRRGGGREWNHLAEMNIIEYELDEQSHLGGGGGVKSLLYGKGIPDTLNSIQHAWLPKARRTNR